MQGGSTALTQRALRAKLQKLLLKSVPFIVLIANHLVLESFTVKKRLMIGCRLIRDGLVYSRRIDQHVNSSALFEGSLKEGLLQCELGFLPTAQWE